MYLILMAERLNSTCQQCKRRNASNTVLHRTALYVHPTLANHAHAHAREGYEADIEYGRLGAGWAPMRSLLDVLSMSEVLG